jgi:hypothetical protein
MTDRAVGNLGNAGYGDPILAVSAMHSAIGIPNFATPIRKKLSRR